MATKSAMTIRASGDPRWIPAAEPVERDGTIVRRYLKEIARPTTIVSNGREREITELDLQHWRDLFAEWRRAGHKVPVPPEHDAAELQEPHMNLGHVVDMLLMDGKDEEGNPIKTLYGLFEMIGEDGKRAAERADVSIYSDSIYINGRHWDRPITHVAATVKPLITGLGDWIPLAASRSAKTMTTDIRKLVAQAFGLAADAADDAIAAAVKTAGETLGKVATVFGLKADAGADAIARAATDAVGAVKSANERATTAEAALSASRGEKPSPTLVRQAAKSARLQFNALIPQLGKPCVEKLIKIFVGDDNTAIAASIQHGRDELIDQLAEALAEAKPLPLGERSGPQTTALSASRGGGGGGDEEAAVERARKEGASYGKQML